MTKQETRSFKKEVMYFRMKYGFPEDIFEMRLFAIHMIDWARKNVEGYDIKKR